ncbi:MAG: flagellar basal body-associated FliL family protein [Gemmatimonadota bacterium]
MASDTAAQPDPSSSDQPAKSGSSKLLLPVVIIAAAALGGGVGALVVAPRLAPAPDKAAHAKAGAAAARAEARVFRLDNMVVNPAGSAGTRFLMVSVAFEVSPELEPVLRAREVQVRDLVTATLEQQTLDMLTRPGARDSLKQALADAVAPITGGPDHVRVYLPQFVIQ